MNRSTAESLKIRQKILKVTGVLEGHGTRAFGPKERLLKQVEGPIEIRLIISSEENFAGGACL